MLVGLLQLLQCLLLLGLVWFRVVAPENPAPRQDASEIHAPGSLPSSSRLSYPPAVDGPILSLRRCLVVHKYLYAHADPVNRIDPSGHESLVSLNTSIAPGLRIGAQIGFRAYMIKARIATAIDGFNAIQQVTAGFEDGIDGEDLDTVLSLGQDFLVDQLQNKLFGATFGIVAKGVNRVARTGIQALGKGRIKFGKFEVRAVRSLEHMNEEDLRKMLKEGNAGKTKAGDTIHLHHHQQNPNGPIV